MTSLTLARSRRAGLASYGGSRAATVATFRRNGSGNSFRFVSEMGVVPFGRRAVLQLALATALPFIPLALLVITPSQILEVLKKVVV
jgi:hypothetical protein